MQELFFISGFIIVLGAFFRAAGFIGHLFRLDDYKYSSADHQFVKKIDKTVGKL